MSCTVLKCVMLCEIYILLSSSGKEETAAASNTADNDEEYQTGECDQDHHHKSINYNVEERESMSRYFCLADRLTAAAGVIVLKVFALNSVHGNGRVEGVVTTFRS